MSDKNKTPKQLAAETLFGALGGATPPPRSYATPQQRDAAKQLAAILGLPEVEVSGVQERKPKAREPEPPKPSAEQLRLRAAEDAADEALKKAQAANQALKAAFALETLKKIEAENEALTMALAGRSREEPK